MFRLCGCRYHEINTEVGQAHVRLHDKASVAQRIGDVITHCNGKPVEGYAMLVETILMKQVGDELPLTVLRNGETHDLTITIGARPER